MTNLWLWFQPLDWAGDNMLPKSKSRRKASDSASPVTHITSVSSSSPNPSSSSCSTGQPTPWPMPLTDKTKPGITLTCLQKMRVWFQASGGDVLLFSKRDTSLFSWTRMFHLAGLASHLNSIPQANNTVKQMERRFSNNKLHKTGHSFACSFERSWAFKRINLPESHGLKHYI